MTTVAGVSHITCACGGEYVRCGGCGHPANLAHNTIARCPVCSAPWSIATPCTRDEFLASRADDAPHPREARR